MVENFDSQRQIEKLEEVILNIVDKNAAPVPGRAGRIEEIGTRPDDGLRRR